MSELRHCPRVLTHLEAELTNGSADTLSATVSNLSPGGVMLRGDLDLKQHICELEERDPHTHAIEAKLRCRLPNEPQPFICRCRLIYIRRLSQKEFDFGFRFIDLSDIHAGMLHRFIFQPSVSKVVPITTRKVGGQG